MNSPAYIFLFDRIVAAIPVNQTIDNAKECAENTQKVGQADILVFDSKHGYPFLLPEFTCILRQNMPIVWIIIDIVLLFAIYFLLPATKKMQTKHGLLNSKL
jgi:hypothetical protein